MAQPLQKVLENVAKNTGCELAHFSSKPMDQKSGFLSTIEIVTATFTDGDGKEKEDFFIFKIPLFAEETEESIFLTMSKDVFYLETNFYELLYPPLTQTMQEMKLPNPLARCPFASFLDGIPYILLDDLKQKNMRCLGMGEVLDDDQFDLVLQSFASIQVAAIALQHKHQKGLKEMFPFLRDNFQHVIQSYVEGSREAFSKDMKANIPDWSRLLPVVDQLCDLSMVQGRRLETANHFTFLCHGDLWNCNVFINSSDCRLIDWQFVSTGNISEDIGTMLACCMHLGKSFMSKFMSSLDRLAKLSSDYCGENEDLRGLVKELFSQLYREEAIKTSLQRVLRFFIAGWVVVGEISADAVANASANLHGMLEYLRSLDG